MATDKVKKTIESTYAQTLKFTSIIGGAQGVNYLIGMLRMKFVAVLLGPTGVGLIGLYQSTLSLVTILSGMGIGNSGVREIAVAYGSEDSQAQAQTVKVLRRVCWATGFLGWVLTISLAWPLSLWTFGSGDRAVAVGVLGVTVLLAAVSGGQRALLQGTRRITDLAKLNVIGAAANTLIAIVIYYFLGEGGIVPVLIVTATVNLGFTWWFARRVQVVEVDLTWKDTWAKSRALMVVGLAFMWSALLAATVALFTRSLIVSELGLEANGIYQAAWGLSGMFAAFILQAMGADFYPRLTAVAGDNEKVNQMVNEQTEIGILLAVPGLLGTLTFAPVLMHVFYTAEFIPAADLLPWFVLGVLGRVIGWPMGMIQMAKGASRWMFFSQTHANVLLLVLTIVLLKVLGLVGVAIAFAILYPIQITLTYWIAHRLSRFAWSRAVLKLLAIAVIFTAIGFLAQLYLPVVWALTIGFSITAWACMLSLRGIAIRLGEGHRVVATVLRCLPFLKPILRHIDDY